MKGKKIHNPEQKKDKKRGDQERGSDQKKKNEKRKTAWVREKKTQKKGKEASVGFIQRGKGREDQKPLAQIQKTMKMNLVWNKKKRKVEAGKT